MENEHLIMLHPLDTNKHICDSSFYSLNTPGLLDSLENTTMKAVTRIIGAEHFGITDPNTGTKQ